MSIKSYGLALMRWIGWTVDSSRYQSGVIEESGFRQIASIISGLADISVISDSILGPPKSRILSIRCHHQGLNLISEAGSFDSVITQLLIC